jgi:hypothetical protein
MIYTLVPWFVSIVLAVGTGFFVGSFIDPATCSDGWDSQSIGKQGACSWHGGVERDPLRFAVIPSSLFVGYISFFYIAGVGFIKNGSEKYHRQGKIFCPVCDSEMRKIRSYRGEFYGCAKFPSCKGKRTLEEGAGSRQGK